MIRPFLCSLTLAAFLLAACATVSPKPLPTVAPEEPTATVPPRTTSTPSPQRATLLRVATLGETTTTNVWRIFDESGSDYWNTATQADYWPNLYTLAPPSLAFQPATASGDPSPLTCDSDSCTATVTLQPDLIWSDGSAFTAEDVAFTVNTALKFRLGLNWLRAYNPDVLDRAESLDDRTVKFYFKVEPTIADWQYGVLLGPIVNRSYWEPRIVDAVSLLPDESLLPTILELEAELATMQADIDALNLSLNTMAPASTVYAETSREAGRLQEELNSIYNKLEDNRSEYQTKLAQGREVLFELANANEPTLGPWMFAGRVEGQFENQVNLGTPFGAPWFDRVRYSTYPNEFAAVRALLNDEADLILLPEGLSSSAVSHLKDDPEITLERAGTRSVRFLAFNHANPYLADPALHQALTCMLDPQELVDRLSNDAVPLPGFVLDGFWDNAEVMLPCAHLIGEARQIEAVRLLKEAGYSWNREPGPDTAGNGLMRPGELLVPSLNLLAPEQDLLREITAKYIAQKAEIIGLSVEVQLINSDDLLYAVYGSRDYDLALLGWRLSVYPSYLCDWFMPWEGNPFAYSGEGLVLSGDEGLRTVCEAWKQSTDLETAKTQAYEVQSVLVYDLPLIPLYSDVRFDAYRNVRYPFTNMIDGLGGMYGAPELAIPIP